MATPKHITFTLTDSRLSQLNNIQKTGIGSEIIRIIEARTKRGQDKNGNQFSGYKESYRKSSHFKAAGKTPQVNLTFSDEMLNSMVYLPNLSEGDKVTVGFRLGSESNNRAQYVIEGHGRKGDFTQSKRDFMGLMDSEKVQVLGLIPQSGAASGIFLGLSAAFLSGLFNDNSDDG